MDKTKTIKLTLTDEMYAEIMRRSSDMSISMPAFCCYIIGEKPHQYKLAEETAKQILKDKAAEL